MGQAAAADAMIVYTRRFIKMCPQELRPKMFVLPQYARNTPSVSTLQARRRAMEDRMDKLAGRGYVSIFGGGRSDRDFETLVLAVRGLQGIILQLFTGGLPVETCTPDVPCVVMAATDRQTFEQAMEAALLVVVPIRKYAKAAAGLSTLYTAMRRGKLVAITEHGDGLTDGLLAHGVDGFRVAVG